MKLDTQWIVGFIDGEGSFDVVIDDHDKTQSQVLPEFKVVQQQRDIQVLHALKAQFGCGVVRNDRNDQVVYRVQDVDKLINHVVPFFEKHSLKTKKRVVFSKFRTILIKMQRGEHLQSEGLDEIRTIIEQMQRVN